MVVGKRRICSQIGRPVGEGIFLALIDAKLRN